MTPRLLPQDLDAEKALLGSMMMDRAVIDEIVPLLPEGEAAFAVPAHATIYRELLAVHAQSRPMDLVLVTDHLRSVGRLEEIGGQEYLVQLAESFAEWANAPHYASVVRRFHQVRRCIAIADRLSTRAYTEPSVDPMDLCAEGQVALDAVLKSPVNDQITEIRNIIPRLQATWDHRRERATRTGWPRFDGETGGFERPSMVVIGARPSNGKTSLGLALCLQAARDGTPALFVSLETSVQRIAERITAMLSGASVRRLTGPEMSPDEKAHCLRIAADKMVGAPFFVVDQNHVRNLREIVATCRTMCRRHGIGVIAVDYLQLVEPGGKSENRNVEITKVSAGLKGLAVQTNTVLFALSQLNRSGEGMKPNLSALRESGAIEQDADMVVFLHRDDFRGSPGDMSRRVLFMLEKNKDGPTFEAPMKFHMPTNLFWPVSESSEEYGDGVSSISAGVNALGMAGIDIPF